MSENRVNLDYICKFSQALNNLADLELKIIELEKNENFSAENLAFYKGRLVSLKIELKLEDKEVLGKIQTDRIFGQS